MPKYVIEREIPGAAISVCFAANRISEVKTVIDPTTSEDKKAKAGKTI